MKKSILLLLFVFQQLLLFAQQFGLVIKGGHVIDPKNNIDTIFDVAISNGRIAKIARHIDVRNVGHVIDARGMYVVPGLVDIHTHVFYGMDAERQFCNGPKSVKPDLFTFCNGVTTIVDAGSSGWKDFPGFKRKIIDSSATRVFAFLNIVGAGMRGSPFEQDTTDMDSKKTALVARQYHEDIVGIKFAHYRGPGWKPLDEAIRAGELAKVPVMIDFGESPNPLSLRELFLFHMRPGDIFTHCFAQVKGRETVVDTGTGKLKSFIWEAEKKGIQWDLGYGEISFSFFQAIPSVEAGFFANSLSTDMHASDKNNMKSLPDIMSEFLALGMSIPGIIKSVTWNPARMVGHRELGNISAGAIADIAILSIRDAEVEFCDHSGVKIKGSKKFACAYTIKSGKIVYHSGGK